MMDTIVTALVFDTYSKTFSDAGNRLGIDVRTFTRQRLVEGSDSFGRFEDSAVESDVILIHMMGSSLPDELSSILEGLRDSKKIISMGRSPLCFAHNTVPKEIALRCYEYLEFNGGENCEGCLRYIQREVLGMDVPVPDVVKVPYHGITDTAGRSYGSLKEYLEIHPPKKDAPWIGLIMSRASWVNGNCDVEYDLVRRFEERGCNTILIYCIPRMSDDGMRSLADAVRRYMTLDGRFLPSAIVKCSVILFGEASGFGKEQSADFLRNLNVPVFQPVIASSMPRKVFEGSPGLKRDIAYHVTYQEFEGTIEPILIGFSREDPNSETRRTPIPERCERLVDRVMRRIALRTKPNGDKIVAFMLNNYPCAGAEANVGEAHNLNVSESLASIFGRMREDGYLVDSPEDGRGIIDFIMSHKAYSDFRWTDSSEIERCGGVLYHMPAEEYRQWFDTLSQKVKDNVKRIWGEPPGESMVRDGQILITGVRFGNVLVMVQPKRGCYGPKCDGTVCRILHDPVCPPTHQYLATYHWLDSVMKVDAIVHTGMHGNMEYLPGKGVGLTSDCYPDICIGTMPHLYIFDAGAPPAASAAKRRGYGTLINHLPPASEKTKPYGPVEDLRVALEQYASAKDDPLRAEEYRRLLVDAGVKAGMEPSELDDGKDLASIVKACTEEYSRITGTRVQIGMHVFGSKMDDAHKAQLIASILSYGEDSICVRLAATKGIDYLRALASPEDLEPSTGRLNAVITQEIESECVSMVGSVLSGRECALGEPVSEIIQDLSRRIDASDEIGSFMNALGGGFVPPGPTGLITHGRGDILPTGRNPFTIDPRGIPTKASWVTGGILADRTVQKYLDDTGEVPESIGMFWMSSDLMNEGGEMMCQIMHLIGVRPEWSKDGQVTGFDIIPLEELGRPRIDVTVRSSGMLMDAFPDCLDLLDSAFVAVSALDEPPERNFVKKHTLASIEDGIPADDATARIFSSAPGSATSGVPLAIYANAWKTERDLAEIYVATNGYAYGNDRNGKPLHDQFMNSLSSSSLTYTKMGTDEYDILGSPGFYGNIGGMSVASRIITGKDVKAYFGDSRIPGSAGVRTLKEEIRRITRARLLNPRWIEGMKENGFQGAAEIMKRSGRVYGYGATTDTVDDSTFDEIAETFINDPEMQEFFRKNNPYAGEEIARRLLEAAERGFWKADPEVLEKLRKNYLQIEGDLEGLAGDGDYQGSSTEIATYRDIDAWKESNGQVMDSVRKRMDQRRI